MTKKDWLTLLGFFLFLFGFLSIILMSIGLEFAFLTWLDAAGGLIGFLLRVLMIVVGLVMVVALRSDFSGEGEDLHGRL